jgi:uncharacterized protein (TIGR02145 family)
MKYSLLTVLALTLSLFAFSQLKDIDGNKYKIVKIGKQEWMAENLNVTHFINGDEIPQAKTNEEWIKAAEEGKPAWCYYDNNPANGKKYGKLYNWFAVNDPRGLAPKGWHIPTDPEWTALTDYLGGEEKSGAKMRSKQGWSDGGNGTNSSSFSGLPGGNRYYDGTFKHVGESGDWWSSTEHEMYYVWYFFLRSYRPIDVNRFDYYTSKFYGLSVRCLRD